MYISVEALLIFFILCIVAGVSIFLIIVLNNVNRFVKKLNSVVDSSKSDIGKTMAALPATVRNLGDAAESIKITMDKTGAVVETIDDVVTGTVETVGDTTENIFTIVKVVGDVIKYFVESFKRED
jgi:ABC-type transporter Mla subunit MlaD